MSIDVPGILQAHMVESDSRLWQYPSQPPSKMLRTKNYISQTFLRGFWFIFHQLDTITQDSDLKKHPSEERSGTWGIGVEVVNMAKVTCAQMCSSVPRFVREAAVTLVAHVGGVLGVIPGTSAWSLFLQPSPKLRKSCILHIQLSLYKLLWVRRLHLGTLADTTCETALELKDLRD